MQSSSYQTLYIIINSLRVIKRFTINYLIYSEIKKLYTCSIPFNKCLLLQCSQDCSKWQPGWEASGPMCTDIHVGKFSIANPSSNMVLWDWRKPENWMETDENKENMHRNCTGSNPSLSLISSPWSCVAAMLPAVTLCQIFTTLCWYLLPIQNQVMACFFFGMYG